MKGSLGSEVFFLRNDVLIEDNFETIDLFRAPDVDRISSVVLRGVSHEGRLIGGGAHNQEQEGNRDIRVRQVRAASTM